MPKVFNTYARYYDLLYKKEDCEGWLSGLHKSVKAVKC
jgi:hypothetical protein